MHTRFFKAAVALSNTGVTLLERHCYDDAIVTIRDALFLIRAAFPGNESKRMWKESAIHFALRRASHCLSRSLPVDERKQVATCNLKVLSDNQSCPTEVVRAINEAEVFAVRIDDSRYDDCVYLMHSEASIILLNYATACRCLHSSDRKPNPSLLHEAFNFLHMAYGILARQFVLPLKQEDEVESSQMISLAMLVLHNLIQLCAQLAMPVQHLNFGNKLGRIMETFLRLNDMPCWSYTHTAPAA